MRWYWVFCFRLTRVYERIVPQSLRGPKRRVLNFGCGNRVQDAIINSDLLAPHRFFTKKALPDFYWSGTTRLKGFEEFFVGLVCEHVIEHILPDDVYNLIDGFFYVISHGGTLVITFPDVRRVLEDNCCQGYKSSTVALNALVYCHGHRFMYDVNIVQDMLQAVGFRDIKTGRLDEMPLNDYLDSRREVETSYISARKP